MSASRRGRIRVELRGIELTRARKAILRDVHWCIRDGEHWLLQGANGAGKTQLLKLLAGDVWPDANTRALRRYFADDGTALPLSLARDQISYFGPERQDRYERYGWNHSVPRIVATGIERSDIPLRRLTPVDRLQVAKLLQKLSITHLARRRFLTLSYGERRLVLLCRALASRPRLLLLDEPFAGLDAQNTRRLRAYLAGSGSARMPWVITSHRADVLPPAITHVAGLDGGRLRRRAKTRRIAQTTHRARAVRTVRATAASAPTVLQLTKASVFLDARPVLRSIDWRVALGECWVLSGANGAGKSTLLRAIYGDHRIAIGGKLHRDWLQPGAAISEFRERVGYVSAELQAAYPRRAIALDVVLSGRHASFNLAAPATAAEKKRARSSLARVDLAGCADCELAQLSYGQQRRVLLARALINEPRLLLLDEPYAGLDRGARHAMMQTVDSLAQEKRTLLLALHHADEWPRKVTHELRLARGRIAYRGRARP
ncbi:MAG: ATP-binding cassette domain-containing protein [Steroidobacteraceae bacterium]